MIFSVSEANNFIKALLDAVPQLQTIFVRGEISNYKLYPSGHHYFTLKDEGSALKCVMFRGMAGKIRFRPGNGMKVNALWRIGVVPRGGGAPLPVLLHISPPPRPPRHSFCRFFFEKKKKKYNINKA